MPDVTSEDLEVELAPWAAELADRATRRGLPRPIVAVITAVSAGVLTVLVIAGLVGQLVLIGATADWLVHHEAHLRHHPLVAVLVATCWWLALPMGALFLARRGRPPADR